jgi:CTD small phosphatase-like protein 2
VPPKRPGAPPVTLVLDLDETLVHSSLEPPPTDGPRPDFSFPVQFEGVHHLVHVRRRPGLRVRRDATVEQPLAG